MRHLYDDNATKIEELDPTVQWAAVCWLSDCWGTNFQFRILSAYRTAEEQHALWLKGRDAHGVVTDPKAIVTERDGYLIISEHQQRLALDVEPIRCSYADLVAPAARYGISHPYTKAPFVDLPHFSFANVSPRPAQVPPEERLRQIERRLKTTKNENLKVVLQGEYQRLSARLHGQ